MAFRTAILSIGQQSQFLAVALFFFTVQWVIPLLLLVIVAIQNPDSGLRLLASWKFWLVCLLANIIDSSLLAAVMTQFPPDHRLVPAAAAVVLMGSAVVWLTRWSERHRDHPAA